MDEFGIDVAHKAPIPAYSVFEGSFTDFQNHSLRGQFRYPVLSASERIAVATGKIDACRHFCEPGVLAQNGHRQLFSGGNNKNARKTPSQRNLNRPQASTMVRDCEVPSHRSPLPACEGEEELSAFVLPPPRNCGEDWPTRVVGILANRLECTSTLPVQITRRGFEKNGLFPIVIRRGRQCVAALRLIIFLLPDRFEHF